MNIAQPPSRFSNVEVLGITLSTEKREWRPAHNTDIHSHVLTILNLEIS